MAMRSLTPGPCGRRQALQRLLVFGTGLPLASNARSATARLRGATVRLQLPAHPHFDRVQKQWTRFTEATGIRVDAGRIPYLDLRASHLASFAKAGGDQDCIAYLITWKAEYAQREWLRPLQPLMADRQWALDGFSTKGVIEPYLEAIGLADGPAAGGARQHLVGLPCGAETSVLVARRDLLARHGLAMPTQYSELLAAAKLLHQREGIAGIASRGLRGHHITHAWLLHLSPHGGRVFDTEWACQLDQPAARRATAVLREIAGMNDGTMARAGLDEVQSQFLGGRAAFYLDSSSLLGLVRDPRHAQMAPQLAYGMHPSASRLAGQVGGFGLGIASNAANPEAAWVLLQWLLSPGTDLAIAKEGGVAARWSSLADPDFRADRPEMAILPFAVRAASPTWRPLVPPWEHISQTLIGQSLPAMVHEQADITQGHEQMKRSIDEHMSRVGYRRDGGRAARSTAT